MPGTSEEKTITITAYRTIRGEPTCAIDFTDGKVCKFLGLRNFGACEVCMVRGVDIKRSSEKSKDYLMPVENCPVWKESA